MSSVALNAWRSTRASRLDRLQSAHTAIGGSGPGRRWVTEELNHALILRLAAEFQGFARDLHDEASRAMASALSAGVAQREDALISLLASARRLSRGNANPDVLAHDFGLFGMPLWADLGLRYPTSAGRWQQRLAWLEWWASTLIGCSGHGHGEGMRMMKTLPRIGDRVIVPFGRGGLEGEVIHISTTLTPPSITVEVRLEGADESTIVTYPADRIRLIGVTKR